ncbi:MAG TPA: hypothetical protein VGF52_03330, partial [Tepidisphaeraceae bacterium]
DSLSTIVDHQRNEANAITEYSIEDANGVSRSYRFKHGLRDENKQKLANVIATCIDIAAACDQFSHYQSGKNDHFAQIKKRASDVVDHANEVLNANYATHGQPTVNPKR